MGSMMYDCGPPQQILALDSIDFAVNPHHRTRLELCACSAL